MSDYTFARRPKWIVGHVLAAIAVVVFISMGFWQLRRLAERQDFNDLLTSRATAAALPLAEVTAAYSPDELELRRVVTTGEYAAAEEIILLARSYNGVSGHHVLTPLYLVDGTAIVVDRGWVIIDLDTPGDSEFAPPAGQVTVIGTLRNTQTRGSFGPVDPPTGTLERISRVDLDRIDQQVAADLLPVYMQLLEQDPAQPDGIPALVPLPTPSEGPHRGYAAQWFLFSAVVVVGYPILLRRTAATKAGTPSTPSSAP
ncbi:MAG: SURF1 family protein [Acidimicrobiia bacterium]|nr:SURF1 family protein [Acidimicrobiia bacterium]